ncbi:Hypothetical predicted protein [Marmota monax]|uniref:Dual specificity mitogen-activated protein kinase kinase 5 n=1 Tax=Marmota monax TaxID=9995 RepID=A0A5E4BZF4_MARMO|nr:dual specificity mitogen-activated protein kinase kinase 5 [Marmota monax]VTJ74865.1 Hypothetical predicted protein [Marmota monax]
MAPREAGPALRLPGFRRSAFWFRSNSALSAALLRLSSPLPPLPLDSRPRVAGTELSRAAPSGSRAHSNQGPVGIPCPRM